MLLREEPGNADMSKLCGDSTSHCAECAPAECCDRTFPIQMLIGCLEKAEKEIDPTTLRKAESTCSRIIENIVNKTF